jgi:predicted ATPase/DNA-binding SARP family transcriptional activator
MVWNPGSVQKVTSLRIAVLGPLEITVGGSPRPVVGARLRALLTRLAVSAGRVVSTPELIEAVWDADPPAAASNALQSLISRLRRTLGEPGLLVAEPGGYRLDVPAEATDIVRFRRLADQAQKHQRAGEFSESRQSAIDALACWRGDPLPDAGDAPYAGPLVISLNSQQLDTVAVKIESDLRCGNAADVLGELEQLAARHPLRETFAEQRMRALAATGRTGEALAAYEQCRSYLADQLGADPSPALRKLHTNLLRGQAETPPPTPQRDAASVPPRDGRRHNLRRGLTSFVGREAELAELKRSFAGSRLTTVLGPGGAGKTRTATEAGLGWLDDGGSACWMIELAPIQNPQNIPGAILAALGDREAAVIERTERVRSDEMRQLLDHLANADCLLIFDNCEHLIDGAAKIIAEILAAAPNVRVLATSREPLALPGESLCELSPLPLPPPDCWLDRAPDYAAVRLLLDRARAIKPDLALSENNLSAVLEIVRRLDGLPLAIELAVARLHALPVGDIARLLTDRFRLLSGGKRTSLPRHQTLAAVVGWSWDLLSEEERLLAERLAVFPAGAGLDAAGVICADNRLAEGDIPQLLIGLVDKSLVQSSAGSPVRFTMLETIREYGQQRLAERGELAAARTAHAGYFYDLALWLEPATRDHRQDEALAIWHRERGNVLAALGWLIESGRGHDALIMLLSQLWGYLRRDQEGELAYWLDRVISANAGRDEPLLPYAETARMMGDLQLAAGWDQVAEQLQRAQHKLAGAPEPPFPTVAMMRRIPELALTTSLGKSWESVDQPKIAGIAGQSGDPWVRGMCYLMAAALWENNGQVALMIECTDRAYAELNQTGDQWNLSRLLTQRARSLEVTGDTRGAIEALTEALRLSGPSVDSGSIFIRLRLTELYARTGDRQAAREQFDVAQGLRDDVEVGRDLGLILDIAGANLDLADGRPDHALRQAAELRSQLAAADLNNMFTAHTGAAVLTSTADIELAAARKTTDPQAQERHRTTAAADLAHGYPAARLTLDLPIMAQFATAAGQLAESLADDGQAAYLLGVGARLIGADDLADLRRGELARRLRSRMGSAAFSQHYRAGQALDRDAAVAACDPQRLNQS